MSDYTGPGIYEILPSYATQMSLNVWEGNTSVGTAVKIYQRTGDSNTQFEIVAAGGPGGNPEIGDREYHIINVKTGLYIANDNEYLRMTYMNPLNLAVRWKLRSHGDGTFCIDSADGRNAFNVSHTSSDSGADMLCLGKGDNPNNRFVLRKTTIK